MQPVPDWTPRSEPVAQWDRAADAVRFDGPELDRIASQEDPDQGLAKLLVAARAEGVGSRWPFQPQPVINLGTRARLPVC